MADLLASVLAKAAVEIIEALVGRMIQQLFASAFAPNSSVAAAFG